MSVKARKVRRVCTLIILDSILKIIKQLLYFY